MNIEIDTVGARVGKTSLPWKQYNIKYWKSNFKVYWEAYSRLSGDDWKIEPKYTVQQSNPFLWSSKIKEILSLYVRKHIFWFCVTYFLTNLSKEVTVNSVSVASNQVMRQYGNSI